MPSLVVRDGKSSASEPTMLSTIWFIAVDMDADWEVWSSIVETASGRADFLEWLLAVGMSSRSMLVEERVVR